MFIKTTIFTINIFNQYVHGYVSLTFLIKTTSLTKITGFQVCLKNTNHKVPYTLGEVVTSVPNLEVHFKTNMGIKLVKKVLALSFIWYL